jgi:hypothetical protein
MYINIKKEYSNSKYKILVKVLFYQSIYILVFFLSCVVWFFIFKLALAIKKYFKIACLKTVVFTEIYYFPKKKKITDANF